MQIHPRSISVAIQEEVPVPDRMHAALQSCSGCIPGDFHSISALARSHPDCTTCHDHISSSQRAFPPSPRLCTDCLLPFASSALCCSQCTSSLLAETHTQGRPFCSCYSDVTWAPAAWTLLGYAADPSVRHVRQEVSETCQSESQSITGIMAVLTEQVENSDLWTDTSSPVKQRVFGS